MARQMETGQSRQVLWRWRGVAAGARRDRHAIDVAYSFNMMLKCRILSFWREGVERCLSMGPLAHKLLVQQRRWQFRRACRSMVGLQVCSMVAAAYRRKAAPGKSMMLFTFGAWQRWSMSRFGARHLTSKRVSRVLAVCLRQLKSFRQKCRVTRQVDSELAAGTINLLIVAFRAWWLLATFRRRVEQEQVDSTRANHARALTHHALHAWEAALMHALLAKTRLLRILLRVEAGRASGSIQAWHVIVRRRRLHRHLIMMRARQASTRTLSATLHVLSWYARRRVDLRSALNRHRQLACSRTQRAASSQWKLLCQLRYRQWETVQRCRLRVFVGIMSRIVVAWQSRSCRSKEICGRYRFLVTQLASLVK